MAGSQCYYCNIPLTSSVQRCPNCNQPLVLHERYRLEGVLGLGGFGVVYAATDTRLDRPCAIKGVTSVSLADQRRIEAEAGILSRYASRLPFIPDIYDIWSEQAQTFLVMEYIDGETLDRLAAPPWPAAQVEHFLRTILGYLAHLHSVGIVHRDLKPQNIKFTSQGRYVLLDFGIAKQGSATMTANKALSPDYASPEQVQGAPTDGRSDLYSLAATAYHLLTSRLPTNVLVRLGTGAQPPAPSVLVPGVPANLEQALLAMLELDPAARPADAQAAFNLLGEPAELAPTAVPVLPPPRPYDPALADLPTRPVILPHPGLAPALALSSTSPAIHAGASTPVQIVMTAGPVAPATPPELPPVVVIQRTRTPRRRRWGVALLVIILGAIAVWTYQVQATTAETARATAQAIDLARTAQAGETVAAQIFLAEETATLHAAALTRTAQTDATALAAELTRTAQANRTATALAAEQTRIAQTSTITATQVMPTRAPTNQPVRQRTPISTIAPTEPPPAPTEPPPAPTEPAPVPTAEPTAEPSNPDSPRRRPTQTPQPPPVFTATPTDTTAPPTEEPTEEPYPAPPERTTEVPPTHTIEAVTAEPPTAEPPTAEPPTAGPYPTTGPTDEPAPAPTPEPSLGETAAPTEEPSPAETAEPTAES